MEINGENIEFTKAIWASVLVCLRVEATPSLLYLDDMHVLWIMAIRLEREHRLLLQHSLQLDLDACFSRVLVVRTKKKIIGLIFHKLYGCPSVKVSENASFVLNIGGSYNPGTPTRSLYHFKLLIALVEEVGFHLAQECFWYNPAKMPMPAEWVTVRRIRVRDSVEYVWWLSKTPWPKASNLSVLKEYSEDMIRLNRNGVRGTVRPSGHVIRNSFDKIDAGGAIPTNVTEADLVEVPESMLKMGNNAANDAYTK